VKIANPAVESAKFG